jgi:hypothetical protein
MGRRTFTTTQVLRYCRILDLIARAVTILNASTPTSSPTQNTGRDYVYKVVSINGVPFQKSALTREQHLKIARDAVAAFDALR